MNIIFGGRHYDDDNLWEEDNKSKMEVFAEEMLWNEPIFLIWFSVFLECAINAPMEYVCCCFQGQVNSEQVC